jgi:hypothetical protein
MAVFQHVYVPTSASGGVQNTTTATLTTGTSSAEIVLGQRQLFMVTAFAQATGTTTNNLNLRFGTSGMSAATVADMGLPINGPTFSVLPMVFDTGEEFDRIRIFNNSTASIVYYVMKLNRA